MFCKHCGKELDDSATVLLLWLRRELSGDKRVCYIRVDFFFFRWHIEFCVFSLWS